MLSGYKYVIVWKYLYLLSTVVTINALLTVIILFIIFHLIEPSKYGYQTELKKVDLSVVPNVLCQKTLQETNLGKNFDLHESFLCAGGITGVDACKVSESIVFVLIRLAAPVADPGINFFSSLGGGGKSTKIAKISLTQCKTMENYGDWGGRPMPPLTPAPVSTTEQLQMFN